MSDCKKSKFKRWIHDEENEAEEVNSALNEITIIIWNLLLLNGGAVFFMASLSWAIFEIPFEILKEEAMNLITLYTWWLSIFAFCIHVLMFMSHRFYDLVHKLMPSAHKNMFYENTYIITSLLTPIVYIFLIPHDEKVTNFIFYFLIFNIGIALVLGYFKWLKIKAKQIDNKK